MANKTFEKARKIKRDEFYTRLQDIEYELKHYKEHFKNKIVLCNCDDPEYSNFFFFFKEQFQNYQLKKLITTHYKKDHTSSYKIEITYKNGIFQELKIPLKENGDFRSQECVELLKESDIVVTNPPFSLFRVYVKQLIDYNKKFLIVGPKGSPAYKDIFKLFKENKIWLGFGFKNGSGTFINKFYKDLPSLFSAPVFWYTNLEHNKRYEELILWKSYNPNEYLKYANYNAINVNKTTEIPKDYNGIIGVPISFLDKFNPNQFEIIGLGRSSFIQMDSYEKLEILKDGKSTGKYTIVKDLYLPYIPKSKNKPAYRDKQGNLYQNVYVRILIKIKK